MGEPVAITLLIIGLMTMLETEVTNRCGERFLNERKWICDIDGVYVSDCHKKCKNE